MKNAHLRFGFAEFEKVHKDAASKVRLIADQFIGQPTSGDAHLLSVFGGDSDVGAIAAAIQMNELFLIGGPGMSPKGYRLGERAHLYRGTITLPGRKRPVRHRIRRLAGLNCSPVIVTGTKAEFLDWIGVALKAGDIAIPQPEPTTP